MSEKQNGSFPYKSLGIRLKRFREKRRETVAEVSGAVEIESRLLSEIEKGSRRPSEDILLLLISYFSVRDDEATGLWELAGYDRLDAANEEPAPKASVTQTTDAPIVYTDMVHVLVNHYGLVMNFMQTAPNNQPPLAVSRVGMSKEHARSMLELLQKTLEQVEPKSLPSPDTSVDKQIKNRTQSDKDL